jgi:hypothetical protein
MNVGALVLGGSPSGDGFWSKVAKAGWRALRTLLQGIAAAFPAAGPGSTIVNATYWKTFWASVLVAVTAALVSFFQNVAIAVPDPGQS